jgi:hypothetical protein
VLFALALSTITANAQSTIKHPGQRTAYSFEFEPHLLLSGLDLPGSGLGTGFGAGVHGTVEVAANGFLPKVNDSVGIGFGADWARFDSDRSGRCDRFANGPNGTRICTQVSGGPGTVDTLLVPVVMQWNFWLARRWSVFGEPGLFLYLDDGDFGIHPVSMSAGGRFHMAERVTLTLRLGYPVITLGVSFLL